MCCSLLLGPFAIGCAGPESFRAGNEPAFKTAELRELDLRKNLHEDRDWAEQDR